MSTTEITDPDIAERLDVALNGDTPGDPLHHGVYSHRKNPSGCDKFYCLHRFRPWRYRWFCLRNWWRRHG